MNNMAGLNKIPVFNSSKKKDDKEVPGLLVKRVMSISDREFCNISASTLAHLFKMERSKLSRLFKQQMGLTLEEFLHKERMNRAAYLLRTLDITVKEVSKRIGFCTCDYFIRKFKEYYGIQPGRYKRFKHKICTF